MYDENDWSVQYTEGWDVPTMTRKTKNSTWIVFKALGKNPGSENWVQFDEKRYDFDATDKVHSHSWITKNVNKKSYMYSSGKQG